MKEAAPWVAHAAMSLLYFLLTACTFNALGVVLPRMVTDIGMGWGAAGFGFTLLGLACGLSSLAPAALIRRLGVGLTLMIGAATLAVGFACLGAAHAVATYQAGTVLLGLGFSLCGTVPGVHVVAGLFERRSTALGLYFTIGGLGAVFGPFAFLGVDAAWGSWRAFWLAAAVAALLLGAFAAAVSGGRGQAAEPADTGRIANGWSVLAALRAPQYWMIVSAYTVCLLLNTTLHLSTVQHLTERGLGTGAAAAVVSLAALIAVASASGAGFLGEKVAARTLTLVALGAFVVAALTLSAPQSGGSIALFTLAFGIGLGVSYVATATLLIDFFGRRPNLELYSIMCLISTIAAIGPVLAGMEHDAHGSFVSAYGALALAAAAQAIALLFTPRPRTMGEPGYV